MGCHRPCTSLVYSVLLAATGLDAENKIAWVPAVKTHFVEYLIVSIGTYYLLVAGVVWVTIA